MRSSITTFGLYALQALLFLGTQVCAKYNTTYTGYPPEYCVGNSTSNPVPSKFGIILFPGWEPLDVFGPYDALYTLARSQRIDISWIAEYMEDAITTGPRNAAMNPYNSTAFIGIKPTHNFTTAPSDLEVLLVPGGLGTRAPDLDNTLNFIKQIYPKLQYYSRFARAR
ncbi:uncharacterized protein RCC_12049 [Ramularia collo-cygni]|uniref:DJ-1/PfpI domain-containing protein n=1 Tax=Ramularia collo-cygni TaxID=112498 RepID=A0A2D3UW10_9PEZI|nr:uncharacterized protein RCC_12049 [Ramularia collo-cygni]CZT15226.1 uncharacterized protein RCC_12049 [Ramularia collo-cygni]